MHVLQSAEMSQLSDAEVCHVLSIPAIEPLHEGQAANHRQALVGRLRLLEQDLAEARQPGQRLLDGICRLPVILSRAAGRLVIDHVHLDD